jgi:hypothetical protein
MWAKVITLADITTGDGKHLTKECKEENCISQWSKSKGRDKWHESTGASRVHSNFAHNIRELLDTDRLQPGGTAIVVAPTLQSRCQEKGQDPTGLGRWAWTRLQGTSDYNTSMFSAYRPCLPSGPGVNTVYAQQARHLGTS